MSAQRNPAATNPIFVDVAPFSRIVNRWLKPRLAQWTIHNDDRGDGYNMHPVTHLCEVLFPELVLGSAQRKLYAIQNEQGQIHFDTADLIVCKLGDAFMWQADPELNAIYESVNLLAVDAQSPTCEAAAQQVAELVLESFTKTRSRNATSIELGIAWARVKEIVDAAASTEPITCGYCEQEFEPTRAGRRFCSERCRWNAGYHRTAGYTQTAVA